MGMGKLHFASFCRNERGWNQIVVAHSLTVHRQPVQGSLNDHMKYNLEDHPLPLRLLWLLSSNSFLTFYFTLTIYYYIYTAFNHVHIWNIFHDPVAHHLDFLPLNNMQHLFF